MASLRTRSRKDGSIYFAVLYRLRGKQTSTSFHDIVSATKFQKLVEQVGPAKALEMMNIVPVSTMTVGEWLEHHIDHLTGLEKLTLSRYRAYAHNDIVPVLGAIPLAVLSRDDIARWLQGLAEKGASGKTVANKHGFLSGALNAAVKAGRIRSNPATGARLPATQRADMVCLSHEEFVKLIDNTTEYWRPLIEFLVASGARWGEATALRPCDVDRVAGTVRISRAWKPIQGGYELGAPKTRKSIRTINVPAAVLDKLDYSDEFLFTNRAGHPVRSNGFHHRVWRPAVARAGLDPRPRVHDLRHTCASWLVAAGTPLPVVQAHLGHESIQTTITAYTHLDRRSMSAAADVMAQALDGRQ